jgi:hypothetical protein
MTAAKTSLSSPMHAILVIARTNPAASLDGGLRRHGENLGIGHHIDEDGPLVASARCSAGRTSAGSSPSPDSEIT